jgi:hypothetical protein
LHDLWRHAALWVLITDESAEISERNAALIRLVQTDEAVVVGMRGEEVGFFVAVSGIAANSLPAGEHGTIRAAAMVAPRRCKQLYPLPRLKLGGIAFSALISAEKALFWCRDLSSAVGAKNSSGHSIE